jgi:hypothetical protein
MRIQLLASLRRALILGGLAALAALPALAVKAAHAETTDAMLDSLQATAFQYFWNEANPANGLIKDRDTAGSPASIAAVGFGLTAICIGVDHGWVSRSDAQARVQTTLETFWYGPQGPAASGIIGYQGLFYHFLDMNTATRTWDSELSTIDTALLMAGILDAKMYFSTSDPGDVTIRALADSIYRRADWEWARNSTLAIEMGWLPTTGFSTFGGWVGYNEAMILYILALGSPTHPANSGVYSTWLSGYSWQTQYGQTYIVFPPLFGHQYSQCWLDLRHARDNYNRFRGISYFENSRRATLAQRAYAIANPSHFTGYSDSLWGLTASDVPSGYNARGAPPAQNDDGTITPTAPISSIAFAPDEVIPVIRNLYNGYKPVVAVWIPGRLQSERGLVGHRRAGDRSGADHHHDRELPDLPGVVALHAEHRRAAGPVDRALPVRRRGCLPAARGRDAAAERAQSVLEPHLDPLRAGAAGPCDARHVRPRRAPGRDAARRGSRGGSRRGGFRRPRVAGRRLLLPAHHARWRRDAALRGAEVTLRHAGSWPRGRGA